MFSGEEQKAVEEKLGQLRNVMEKKLSPKGLAGLIAKRRVGWMLEHKDGMMAKYEGLSPEEQAHRIIFLEHMKINPEHSKVVRVSPTKIRIESYQHARCDHRINPVVCWLGMSLKQCIYTLVTTNGFLLV